MAVIVATLVVTDSVCMNRTTGHIGPEKIHSAINVLEKVKGMQKIAIRRSARARFVRKAPRSDFQRLDREKTVRSRRLPTAERTVVRV